MKDGTDQKNLISGIETALDEIRPHLKSDGGDIEVLEVTAEHIVKVVWKGNCQVCRFSDMTMKSGVEQVIKNKYPFITGVEAVNPEILSHDS